MASSILFACVPRVSAWIACFPNIRATYLCEVDDFLLGLRNHHAAEVAGFLLLRGQRAQRARAFETPASEEVSALGGGDSEEEIWMGEESGLQKRFSGRNRASYKIC